jgi:hypothetical protein
MEAPKTRPGRLTEEIMMAIHQHIKPGGLNPGEVAHYNRAWEKVYSILNAQRDLGDRDAVS